MSKYVISIDFGGTNIKFGLVQASGRIIAKGNLFTQKYHHKNQLIAAIVQEALKLIEQHKLKKEDVLGVGIGLPGLVDPQKGFVRFLPNVQGWKNVALKAMIQKQLKIPVFIDNDVNVMALGEWKYGAGKGFQNILCMTLGTGVGGGLILDGKLYRGKGFAAGEIGHMPLNEHGPLCNCGGQGCFERYVGNQVLQEKAAKIFKNKNMTLEEVYRLAVGENCRAVQFWEEAAVHIGNALVGVINLLNPEKVIIGGGVANSYRFLGKTIQEVIQKRCMKTQSQMVKVSHAKLGNDAALLGALVLVQENL